MYTRTYVNVKYITSYGICEVLNCSLGGGGGGGIANVKCLQKAAI